MQFIKSLEVFVVVVVIGNAVVAVAVVVVTILFTLLPDVNNNDIRMILSIRKTAKKSVQNALIIKNHNYEYSLLLFLLVGIQLSQMVNRSSEMFC